MPVIALTDLPLGVAIVLALTGPWVIALLAGRLVTRGQLLRELKARDDAHAENTRIQDGRLADALAAVSAEKTRANSLNDRLLNMGDGLGRVAVHLLDSLPQTGDAETSGER